MSTLPSINTHTSNSIFSPKKQQIPPPSNYIGNSNTNSNSPTNRSSLSTIRLQQINSEKSFNPDLTQQYPVLVQNNCKPISDPDSNSNSNVSISKNISEDILNLALFTVEMSFVEFNAISIEKLLSNDYAQIVPNCWATNILVYYKQLENPIKVIEKKYNR